MNKWIPILVVAAILVLGPLCAPVRAADWAGVDETVIEKFAEKAGRPAREPFINTDQGDLLLFVFLLAGAIGGFAAGYWFRVLFPPRKEGETIKMVRPFDKLRAGRAHHDRAVVRQAHHDKDFKS